MRNKLIIKAPDIGDRFWVFVGWEAKISALDAAANDPK